LSSTAGVDKLSDVVGVDGQQFVVRRARVEDLPAVVDLLAAVAEEGRWIGAEGPVDRADRLARLRGALGEESQALYVATAAEQVIGELGLKLQLYGVAELSMLVATRWRSRGVGSALLAAGVEWAREAGAHKVGLQVWPHNAVARALYRKFGFIEEGVLRRHYRRRNGEIWDAVVMGLGLDADAVH
jgi:RimJ/RimL family protein N-acetyltransferase